MTRGAMLGRRILLAMLILTALYVVSADVSHTHLYNPEWPPHARFHIAQMVAMVVVDVGLGIWLLCHRAADPTLGATVASVLLLAFWLPILWVTWVVPGTDLRAAQSIPVPTLWGVRIYLNVVAALVAIVLTSAGWWLVRAFTASTPR